METIHQLKKNQEQITRCTRFILVDAMNLKINAVLKVTL